MTKRKIRLKFSRDPVHTNTSWHILVLVVTWIQTTAVNCTGSWFGNVGQVTDIDLAPINLWIGHLWAGLDWSNLLQNIREESVSMVTNMGEISKDDENIFLLPLVVECGVRECVMEEILQQTEAAD